MCYHLISEARGVCCLDGFLMDGRGIEEPELQIYIMVKGVIFKMWQFEQPCYHLELLMITISCSNKGKLLDS